MAADMPRINRILKRFDPTALPSARPLSPFLVATIEVTSSGREVPMAMMVNPIKFWLTPKFALVTPFDQNGSINYDAFGKLIDDQIAAEDDSGKSATHKEDTFRKRQYLTDLAFFTVAQGGTDHACDVENHSCQKKKTFDAAKRSIEKHEAQNQRDQNIDGHVPL